MPVLSPNKPLTQDSPTLLVENELKAGRHRFSLVVRNERGVASEAQEFVVTVQARVLPLPPIRPTVIEPPLQPIDPIVSPVTPIRPIRPRRTPR